MTALLDEHWIAAMYTKESLINCQATEGGAPWYEKRRDEAISSLDDSYRVEIAALKDLDFQSITLRSQ